MSKKSKKNGLSNPHTSAFSRENQGAISKNLSLKNYSTQLFNTLVEARKARGEEVDFDHLFLDLEVRFDAAEGRGILREMQLSHAPVTYGMLQMEACTLAELKNLKLRTFPSTNPSFQLKVEQAFLYFIKNEFSRSFSSPLKKEFDEYIKYDSSSLKKLLATITNFPQLLNDQKQKSTVEKRIQTFVLPFHKIVTQLEVMGEDMSALKHRSFSDWTTDQQRFADAFMSKSIFSRLYQKVQEAKNLIGEVKTIFDKVSAPISTIFLTYPCSVEELLQKYPEEKVLLEGVWQELEKSDLDEHSIQALLKQQDDLIRKIYLRDLESKNTSIAWHLKELLESDFDFSRLTQPADFFQQLAIMRYKQLEDAGIVSLFSPYPQDFKDFFLTLFDLNSDTLQLNGKSIPIKKRVLAQSHPQLQNLSDFQLFDTLPLEFELDLTNLNLSIEDKAVFEQLFKSFQKDGEDQNKLVLKGKDLGRLLYLFKMGEDSLFDRYDPRKARDKLGNFFSELEKEAQIAAEKNKFKKPDLQSWSTSEENDSSSDEKEENPEEQKKAFYEERNKLAGMQGNEPNFWFKKGALIYFSLKESELPPYENAGNARNKMEITWVDESTGRFKAKIYGAERMIENEDNQERGPFPMEAKWLKEKFGMSWGNLLSAAQKVTEQKKDFNQQLEAFKQAGICDEKVLGDAVFKNGKFMTEPVALDGTKGKEEEARYFWISDVVPDPKGAKMKRYNVLYKVTPNADHTITVESDFVHHDGESKTYKHKMTYSDFLFFLKEKNLTPKTQQQAMEEQKASQDVLSSSKRKWKFTSIHSIVYGIKNIWKNLNSKLDEYQKEQDEAFLGHLVNEVGIYKILGNTLGFIPSIKDAANKLHEEAMLKQEGEVRKSIEAWINKFKSMQDYANLFEKGFDHPNGYTLDAVIGKGNTLQKILLSGKSVYNNDTLRPIMAAAMIANLRNGKGLYRGLSGKDNQGLWVKCLLGDGHYARYRKIRADVLDQIKRWVKNADQLQDQLKKSEIDYIVNNIRNSNGTEGAFGSIDDDNKQVLKQLYSDKFAWELESAANEMTGKGAVEWAYGKIAHNNFAIASNDFKRFIKSGRIESALGNLKKMGDLAKTNEHHKQLAVAMTYVMISGVMNRYGDKATRKWFDALARTYMIPTAFFAKKWENQKYSVHLLDQIFPKPDRRNFSLATGYKISDFDENSSDIPYGKLLDSLDIWRRNNQEDIDDFFKELKGKDCRNDSTLKAIQDKMREKNEDNLDGDWAGNSWITGHYAILASPSTIGRNKSYDRSWFTGKDIDEKNDKADFWKDVLKDLKNISKRPNGPEFLLKQFVTRFVSSEGEYSEIISWLKTANAVKKYGPGKALHIPTHSTDPSVPQSVYSTAGYKNRDYKDLLWYLFKGKVLKWNSALPPNEFEAVLDFFYEYFSNNLPHVSSDSVLENVFGASVLKENGSRPTTLIPWEEYNKYVDKNNPFGQNYDQKWDKSAQWKKRFYRSELFMNDKLVALEKEMNRIGVSGIPWLSGVDDDLSYQTHQEVYKNVA